MVVELEKQFFDTFGIEPIACNDCIECYEANTTPFPWCEKLDYPQISDRILLELICIYNVFVRMDFYSSYVKDLKIEVLETLIKEYKNRKQTGAFDENLKEKVQALFKEGK